MTARKPIRERLIVPLVQWLAFLFASAALVLFFLVPIALYLNFRIGFDETSDLAFGSTILWCALWIALTGALAGLTYRAIALGRRKAPSRYFAFTIPLFGAISHTLVINQALMRHPSTALPGDFGLAVGVGYVCAGVALIPLSIPIVESLAWLHQTLDQWAKTASPRVIIRAAYGVACLCLLSASEAPRLCQSVWRDDLNRATQSFGVPIPPGSVLLAHFHSALEYETYQTVDRGFFRIEGRLTWPPRPRTQPVTEREDALSLPDSFESYVGKGKLKSLEVFQTKWYEGDTVTVATLVRTPTHDYLGLMRR